MYLSGEILDDIIIQKNKVYADQRGWLYEGYRDQKSPTKMEQITIGQSVANSIRGMHVHYDRHDYVMVLSGRMRLGLADMRPCSSTYLKSCMILLEPEATTTVYIPPGIGHGFGFEEDSLYITGLSTPWSIDDEVAFYYDDPNLNFNWELENPLLSEKDQNAQSWDEALRMYNK